MNIIFKTYINGTIYLVASFKLLIGKNGIIVTKSVAVYCNHIENKVINVIPTK
jgi:hypothetical protein